MLNVIKAASNDAMSNKEKMQAICGYLLSNFTYDKTVNGKTVFLFADEGIPYWRLKTLNSSSSPELLVEFGKDLGYPLEDCYNWYSPGTSEWYAYHSKVYSKADDTYFNACPPSGSAEIGSVTMFNPSKVNFWLD